MYQHFALGQHWLSYLPLARFGVQLFFVLSGFLITSILLVARERIARGESWLFELRQFYMRRVLKIFPLYYMVVLGCAIFGISGFRGPLLWHFGYMTNIYNAVTGTWAEASAHLWTLSVEKQFYLFWPWVILLVSERWLLPVLTAIVAAAPLFRSLFVIFGWANMALYTLTPSSLDALGLGALLAGLRQRERKTGDSLLRPKLMRVAIRRRNTYRRIHLFIPRVAQELLLDFHRCSESWVVAFIHLADRPRGRWIQRNSRPPADMATALIHRKNQLWPLRVSFHYRVFRLQTRFDFADATGFEASYPACGGEHFRGISDDIYGGYLVLVFV